MLKCNPIQIKQKIQNDFCLNSNWNSSEQTIWNAPKVNKWTPINAVVWCRKGFQTQIVSHQCTCANSLKKEREKNFLSAIALHHWCLLQQIQKTMRDMMSHGCDWWWLYGCDWRWWSYGGGGGGGGDWWWWLSHKSLQMKAKQRQKHKTQTFYRWKNFKACVKTIKVCWLDQNILKVGLLTIDQHGIDDFCQLVINQSNQWIPSWECVPPWMM